MIPWLRWLVLSALLVSGLPLIARASEAALVLQRDQGFYLDAEPHHTLWRAQGESSALPDAIEALAKGQFKAIPAGGNLIGFTREHLWLHLSVHNRDHPAARWLWVLEQPRIDEIDIYLRTADGQWQLQAQLGDQRPFSARSAPHRFPNWMTRVRQGQGIELLLRLRSTSSIQLPLRWVSETEFFKRSHHPQIAMGLYFGLLLALAVFNLAVLLSIRDWAYAWYVGYVISFGLMMAAFHGFGMEYLWFNWPRWQNLSLPIGILLTALTGLAFTRSFLDLDRQTPRLAMVYRIASAGLVLLVVPLLVGWIFPVTIALNVAVIVLGLSVLGVAIQRALSGYRPAWFFLLAWVAVLLFGIAIPLSSFGWLPRTALTEFGLQIGSAIEMLLLSLSLTQRINLLRSENVRIAREAREQLEQRVEERTRALNQANEQLAQANARLQEFSLRDGLTGVFNRHHLDAQTEVLWHQHREQQRPLSLLMLDLDHFKRINDEYGHAVGDECLRQVSQLIQSLLAPRGALVARYGGEEFAVLLPGFTATDAVKLAEQLRQAVANMWIDTGRGRLPISVSIGVAEAAAFADSGLASWMRAADLALYRAKSEGRNRVHRAHEQLI